MQGTTYRTEDVFSHLASVCLVWLGSLSLNLDQEKMKGKYRQNHESSWAAKLGVTHFTHKYQIEITQELYKYHIEL